MTETAIVTVNVVTYAAITPLKPLELPPTRSTSSLSDVPACIDCTNTLRQCALMQFNDLQEV